MTRDIIERMAWTFVQAFLASEGLSRIVGGEFELAALQAAALAGVAAVLSLIKGLAATKVGQPDAALPSAPTAESE